MRNSKAIVGTAATALVAGALLVPAVSASAQPARSTPAMEHAATTTPAEMTERDEPRAAAGVARALYAGFKAATSPRDAAKVLSWASVLGRSSVPDSTTTDVQASYFDR